MVMEISFDHLGLKTKKKKEGESWVESTRVWVTNPKEHPFNVEWLRYEPDEESAKGLRTLIEPFEVGGFLKVGFYEYKDGTIVELMEYLKDPDQWFPDEA
jgi:hypothetical protein